MCYCIIEWSWKVCKADKIWIVLNDHSGYYVENGLYGSKVKERTQEAIAIVQIRDDGALGRGDSNGRDEKWLHSAHILKVGLIRLADGSTVEQEKGVEDALFLTEAIHICIYNTGSGPESGVF